MAVGDHEGTLSVLEVCTRVATLLTIISLECLQTPTAAQ